MILKPACQWIHPKCHLQAKAGMVTRTVLPEERLSSTILTFKSLLHREVQFTNISNYHSVSLGVSYYIPMECVNKLQTAVQPEMCTWGACVLLHNCLFFLSLEVHCKKLKKAVAPYFLVTNHLSSWKNKCQ